MRTQSTTEPPRQKIRVQRRAQSTGSVPERAQSEALSPCDDLQARIPNGPTSSILNEGLTTDMPLTIGYRLSGRSSVPSAPPEAIDEIERGRRPNQGTGERRRRRDE